MRVILQDLLGHAFAHGCGRYQLVRSQRLATDCTVTCFGMMLVECHTVIPVNCLPQSIPAYRRNP